MRGKGKQNGRKLSESWAHCHWLTLAGSVSVSVTALRSIGPCSKRPMMPRRNLSVSGIAPLKILPSANSAKMPNQQWEWNYTQSYFHSKDTLYLAESFKDSFFYCIFLNILPINQHIVGKNPTMTLRWRLWYCTYLVRQQRVGLLTGLAYWQMGLMRWRIAG